MNTAQQTYKMGQSVYCAHSSGFYFNEETPDPVRQAIASAYARGTRVRVFNGDAATGRAWPEEWGVMGTIGRSMGPCRIPLLIHSTRSMGGAGLLDSCIVAMFDTSNGRVIYRHPSFDPGQWTVGPSDMPEYVECALHNGELHARFTKPGQAARYCAFMRGDRFTK